MSTERGKQSFIERAPKDRDNPYGMIRRAVFDGSGLSFEARGVLGYVLMKPDSWRANTTDIRREGGIGRDQANRIMNELIEKGYAQRIEERDEQGRIAGVTYRIFEEPLVDIAAEELPCTESPCTGKPATVNPHHSNKGYIVNTDIKKETKKVGGVRDAAHPNTRPILDTYVELLGFTPAPSKFARLGPDAKEIAKRGYGPEDVRYAYGILQFDKYWKDKTITLSAILETIEKKQLTIRNGKAGSNGQVGASLEWTPEELERARAAKRSGNTEELKRILSG